MTQPMDPNGLCPETDYRISLKADVRLSARKYQSPRFRKRTGSAKIKRKDSFNRGITKTPARRCRLSRESSSGQDDRGRSSAD